MEGNTLIKSTGNALIKFLKRLRAKASARKEVGLSIVEGEKEHVRALQSQWIFDQVFICEESVDALKSLIAQIEKQRPKAEIFLVSRQVYEDIAVRGSVEGIVSTIKPPDGFGLSLADSGFKFEPSDWERSLVFENLEKPGNLGAVCRTALAFGFKTLVLVNPCLDLLNPNCIRNSIGALFDLNIFTAHSAGDCIAFLEEHQIQGFSFFLGRQDYLHQTSWDSSACALIFGNEHTGLTADWSESTKMLSIQMDQSASVDSLNLSNAVAIAAHHFTMRSKT